MLLMTVSKLKNKCYLVSRIFHLALFHRGRTKAQVSCKTLGNAIGPKGDVEKRECSEKGI